MAPKSSDGSSSENFPTAVASSLLRKCKVEFSTPENTDDSEGGEVEGEGEEGEEVEGEGEDVEDRDTDWDKDSFDGHEYHSSDHSEYSDEEFHQKCRNYNRAVVETKGFFEEPEDFPDFLWAGIATVHDLDGEFRNGITNRDYIGTMVFECVDKYNKVNKKNLIYERVLRANFNPGGRTTYYVTIAARESPDGPLLEYQAKVVWFAGASYPIFCRPSPIPK